MSSAMMRIIFGFAGALAAWATRTNADSRQATNRSMGRLKHPEVNLANQ
jgi:hypothetical protein